MVASVRRMLRGPARMWRASARAWRGLQARVRPVEDIPAPIVNMQAEDPVSAIVVDPSFQDTVRWFAQDPTQGRSLLSPDAQALLFALVRNLRPEHAFEIGTFRAGTSEAIARALHANGTGLLHTVDPFGLPHVPAILVKWPRELRRRVRFYPVDSMAFHVRATRRSLVSGLTFIDGNHDYEYALFDLHAAGRSIAPGGFVLVDNISQPGPWLAAQDFSASTAGWSRCGGEAEFRPLRPFDRQRAAIANTDLLVLRAPQDVLVGARPVSFGLQPVFDRKVSGITLTRKPPLARGTLSVQCILRTFAGAQPVAEQLGGATVEIDDTAGDVSVEFERPIVADGRFDTIIAEPILVWSGSTTLVLAAPPRVI
jgi:hypothetical protein